MVDPKILNRKAVESEALPMCCREGACSLTLLELGCIAQPIAPSRKEGNLH
jgi:hypothetical protein